MTSVSRSFTVNAPQEVVVRYLADFANAEEWDPGTVRCVPIGGGPVAIGSSWRNTSKIAGISTELTYTLKELTESRIVLIGVNDTATSTETIEVRSEGAGSSITYTNDLQFKGAAKLVTPLARVIFAKLADDTENQLVTTLNALRH